MCRVGTDRPQSLHLVWRTQLRSWESCSNRRSCSAASALLRGACQLHGSHPGTVHGMQCKSSQMKWVNSGAARALRSRRRRRKNYAKMCTTTCSSSSMS
eukprot:s1952_g14.t1